MAYVVGARDRGDLKGALLHTLLGGLTRAEIAQVTEPFVSALVARGLHDEALPVLENHRAAGDVRVLMSASPDLYVPRIAAALGFDDCVCSPVRWNGDRLDGRLTAPNVHGEEKARQLERLRQRFPGHAVIAYGNAGSDLPHLLRCETAVYVNAAPGERHRLAEAGMTLVSWH
jgi:phosphatidylglycerophosphatase C